MKSFAYVQATSVSDAVSQVTAGPGRTLLSGGIDLVDLMKEHLLEPDTLVATSGIGGINTLTAYSDGRIRLGARMTLAEVAASSVIASSLPALVSACSEAATPQIRNRATLAGNLLQRPRCWYFRSEDVSCLKKGGASCPGVTGDNRYLAILGGGPCYAVQASSTSIALTALDAMVQVTGTAGSRAIALSSLYVSPSTDPTREHGLQAGDVVTYIDVPAQPAGSKNAYLKVRHKEAFDWAMAEAAVRLTLSGSTVTAARIVLGGVAPVPWRATQAETLLVGKPMSASLAAQAAAAAVADARPLSLNGYKINAASYVVEQALLKAAGLA